MKTTYLIRPLSRGTWYKHLFGGTKIIQNDMGDRGRIWRATTFRNCHFEANNFTSFFIHDAAPDQYGSFDRCTFVRNKKLHVLGPVTNSHFENNDNQYISSATNCTFKEPGGVDVGVAVNSQFEGKEGAEFKRFENVKIINATRGVAALEGKNLEFDGKDQTEMGGGNLIGDENRSVYNVTIRNHKVRNLYFFNKSHIEASVF